MEPTQQIAQNVTQDLQTFMTIVKWSIGIMAPIFSALSFAVYKLWTQNNAERKRHEQEMHEVWKTTLDVLVEQGKVVERLTAKIEEIKDGS